MEEKAATLDGGSAEKAESENGNWFTNYHSISPFRGLVEIPLQVWIKGAKLKQVSWKGLKRKVALGKAGGHLSLRGALILNFSSVTWI